MPRSSSQASNGPRIRPCWMRNVLMRAHQCVAARGRERAGDHVGMAVEIFRGRVHHDVGAERERPGEHRRRHRRVDGEPRAGPCAISATAAMSVIVHSGLPGVSIQTSLVLPRLHRAAHGREVGGVDEVDAVAEARRLGREPVAERPVHHLARPRCGRARQRHHDRGRRRHAGAEQQRVVGFLERRDHALRPGAPWRCRAGRRRSPSGIGCRGRADRWSPRAPAAPRPWWWARSRPSACAARVRAFRMRSAVVTWLLGIGGITTERRAGVCKRCGRVLSRGCTRRCGAGRMLSSGMLMSKRFVSPSMPFRSPSARSPSCWCSASST